MSSYDNYCIAAIQMVSSARLDDNLHKAELLIAEAVSAGASFILLPEFFCLMGQHDTDKLDVCEADSGGPIQQFLKETAQRHGVWLIGGSVPLASDDPARIYNSCLVFDPAGRLQARYDKIHLFGFDNGAEVFQESDTIRPGLAKAQVFSAPFGPVGLSICYDLRFPELYRAMGDVTLIVVPSAFTYRTGQAHWELLLRARAVENQCYVLAAAQGGRHENGRRTWGHTMMVDPWGTVLDQLPEGEGVVLGRIDLEHMNRLRTALPALKHRRL